MNRRKGKEANPASEIIRKSVTKPERDFEKRFTSDVGPLTISVRDMQAILLGIIANRILLPLDVDNDAQKAVIALAAQSLNLARVAYLTVSKGYPIQALISIRAMYERLAICLDIRSDNEQARRLIEGKVKPKDYVLKMVQGVPEILKEYQSFQGESQLEESTITTVVDNLPKLYGALSSLSHPNRDAESWQFYIDASQQRVMFSIGPAHNTGVIPQSILALTILWPLQFILGTLLFVELTDGGKLDKDKIAAKWEDYVRENQTYVQNALNQLEIATDEQYLRQLKREKGAR
ncbi:MAG: hypothetical protein J5I90_07365 [Caldilineales bacterium]|nr:hypothetical protein [Caldilineales bacterium]